MGHYDLERSYSIPYTFTKGNEMRIDNLLHSPESFKDNFSLTIQESEYTEDENGVRKFFIKGTTTSRLGKRHSQQYVSNAAWTVANFETLDGKVTYMTKEASPANMGTVGSGKHARQIAVPLIWSMTVSGIEYLPDDIMKVRLIVRADGIGGSNLVVIEKKLISNISKENLLKRQQIENQEITFNEQQNSGDFNETPITEINLNNSCSECTGTIPEKQLTENYLKIGGIAAVGVGILLLYTRRNKK